MNFNKKIMPLVLATTITQGLMPFKAFAADDLTPHAGAYGYFVDTYMQNSGGYNPSGKPPTTPATNPAVGALSQFLNIFTPVSGTANGDEWTRGTILDQDIHDQNISTVIDMTAGNTTQAAVTTTGPLVRVFFDDRRNASYSVTDGLGKYTDVFRNLSNANTAINENMLNDALTQKITNDDDREDSHQKGPWASETSELGNMVKLVNTLRGGQASGNPSKYFYQYMRPYRWSSEVKLLPTLALDIGSNPNKDGGFPSGHTNAAYLASIGMAYAAPERFQEMLTRASELGNDRIIAGYHSPLDVMGGRIMGTALAASALYDPNNASLKAAAYNEAQTKLFTQAGTSEDRFSDYKKNKEDYIERLTYGFGQTGDTTIPMKVPKGAEVLLETRLPYLDVNQRRDVLYTTGLESGYPLLDDAEGWGRLNLFAAADGYGAFNSNITVNMDASKGGFNASDRWRNDISGSGALTKQGTGTLKLGGDNTYSGGTDIQGGTIEADSATAFGAGNVLNEGGTLVENVNGLVNIKNDYNQSQNGALELSIGSKDDVLEIDGNATFNGKLKLDFSNSYTPTSGMTIIKFNSNNTNSRFSSIETTGLPSNYVVNLVYDNNSVRLLIGTSDSSSGSHNNSPSNNTNTTNDNATTNSDKAAVDNSVTNKIATEGNTGWQQKKGVWYNLSKDGTVNTGWLKDTDGKWYYLDKTGEMKTGWVQSGDGNWYYLDKTGSMQIGWVKNTDENWYYLSQSGAMKTGWFKDTNGKWYYLNQSGTMEHDKYIDGYYVGSNGAWVE
jgi:autotransporter-associated beta strand protein